MRFKTSALRGCEGKRQPMTLYVIDALRRSA